MKSTPSDSRTWASTKWPIRTFAITGTVTTSMISSILRRSAIRATPPSARISAGTRSSAITDTAPASSAIFACSAFVTSMITPPLSISARPRLTRTVPCSIEPPEVVSTSIVPTPSLRFGVARGLRLPLSEARRHGPRRGKAASESLHLFEQLRPPRCVGAVPVPARDEPERVGNPKGRGASTGFTERRHNTRWVPRQ